MAVPFVKLSPLVRVIKTINDNLEQQAQAIYHERFETVSPNDLPSDWRIVTLGEVATISNKSFNPLKEPEILIEHYSIPAFDEARFPVFELSTSIKSNKFIIYPIVKRNLFIKPRKERSDASLLVQVWH